MSRVHFTLKITKKLNRLSKVRTLDGSQYFFKNYKNSNFKRSNLFDAVISIGVIHHFSTVKRRVRAIQELCRILTPGGKLMIYVWALEQRLRKVLIFYSINF